MGPFLAVLEAQLRDLRPTWKHLGANLGRFVANLAVLDATQHMQFKAKQCVFMSSLSIGGSRKRSKKERGERKARKKRVKEKKRKDTVINKKVKAALRHVWYSVFWNQPGSCVVVDLLKKAVCSLLAQVPDRVRTTLCRSG